MLDADLSRKLERVSLLERLSNELEGKFPPSAHHVDWGYKFSESHGRHVLVGYLLAGISDESLNNLPKDYSGEPIVYDGHAASPETCVAEEIAS